MTAYLRAGFNLQNASLEKKLYGVKGQPQNCSATVEVRWPRTVAHERIELFRCFEMRQCLLHELNRYVVGEYLVLDVHRSGHILDGSPDTGVSAPPFAAGPLERQFGRFAPLSVGGHGLSLSKSIEIRRTASKARQASRQRSIEISQLPPWYDWVRNCSRYAFSTLRRRRVRHRDGTAVLRKSRSTTLSSGFATPYPRLQF